jgi:mono/diheme cytochrome c family protein
MRQYKAHGRMKRSWGPAVAVAGISLALGIGRAEAQTVDITRRGATPDSALLTPDVIDAGRKIFHGRGSCSACHGDKLLGGPVAPALVGPTWRHVDGSFNAILDRIENGLAGTVMMPHPGRITEPQVFMVAAYVWAVSHERATP